MTPTVSAVVVLILTIVAYFVLVRLGRRVFTGKLRAQGAAAAILVAFILGSQWPYARPQTPPVASLPPTAPIVPAGKSYLDVIRNTGDVCRSARVVAEPGQGVLDGARTQDAGGANLTVFRLAATDHLVVYGWAAEPDLSRPARSACVVVDGAIVRGVVVNYGGTRADVATAFGKPALTSSAFVIDIPAHLIGVGQHSLQVAAVSADGSARLIHGGVTVFGP